MGWIPEAGESDHGNLDGLTDDDHTQYVKADGTRAFTGTVAGITPTVDAHLATKGYVDSVGGGGGDPDHDYFTHQAALLEPLAIEAINWSTSISYAVGAAETKWILSAWEIRIGSSGQLDVRDARIPVPVRDTTLVAFDRSGLGAESLLVVLDPSLPTYTDARTTYYDRLQDITELSTKFVGVDAGAIFAPLLPGPYGNIIVSMSMHDVAWFGLTPPMGAVEATVPIHNEIGDASTDDQRISHRLFLPVSKNIMCGVETGAAGGPDDPYAGIAYVILPSTWGKVTDPNTYTFRDDFMGSSLDTVTEWNRTESTAGNVEINTDFAWCKLRGSGTFGENGLFSQDSFAVAADLTFECDVFISASATAAAPPNVIAGFHDGVGIDQFDFAHGVYFSASGGAFGLFLREDANTRGPVGSGYTVGASYRLRITLDGSGGATYEIQGGPEYEPVGGSAWTDITPGTSASTTDPVHAGAVVHRAFDNYWGDVKVYSAA